MAANMPVRNKTGGLGSDDEAVPDTDPSDGTYLGRSSTLHQIRRVLPFGPFSLVPVDLSRC